MSFVKTLVLLLSISVLPSTLATPHIPRSAHHRALVARGVTSNLLPLDVPAVPVKRALRKRCKPRPGQSSEGAHTSSAVANVGAEPSSTKEDHQEAPATTQKAPATTPKATKTAAPEEDKPKPTKDNSPSKGGGNLPSFMSGKQTGQGTFYGTGLGACGITNKDTDFIAAMSMHLFDNFPGYDGGNPNKNPLCGQKVRATYEGKSVTVTITDRCVGCALKDLDFSPAAFNQIANPDLGRINGVTWEWVN